MRVIWRDWGVLIHHSRGETWHEWLFNIVERGWRGCYECGKDEIMGYDMRHVFLLEGLLIVAFSWHCIALDWAWNTVDFAIPFEIDSSAIRWFLMSRIGFCICTAQTDLSQKFDPFTYLNSMALERLYQLGNTRLQARPLHPQRPRSLIIIIPKILTRSRRLTTLNIPPGQFIPQLRKPLPRHLRNITILKTPPNRQVAPPTSLGPLHGTHMRQRRIPHVNPHRNRPRRRNALVPAAADEGHNALVGGVDALERREVVHDGAEDYRRTDGG